MKRKLTAFILAIGLLATLSLGQDKVEKNALAVPNGLALEVNSFQEKTPYYHSIANSAAESKWDWTSKFKQIKDFQTSPDRLPVKAVKFSAYLDKETVKVTVTVFTGVKFFENEETVGVYSMNENQRLTIKELKNFGVEPFEIAVVRLTPTISVLPSFKNLTDSIQLIGIEPIFSTIPSYKVKLFNNSAKTVSAFAFITTLNNQMQLSAMPYNLRNEPLILSGGEFEKTIPNLTKETTPLNNKLPAGRFDHVFVVTAVMFTDGSYEGNVQDAVRYRAVLAGRKSQLKQIVGLLENFENRNLTLEANNLAERALKLDVNASDVELDDLIKHFPAFTANNKPDLRSVIEISSDRVKREFVRDLELQIQKSSAESLRTWLVKTKGEYQDWIKRLY